MMLKKAEYILKKKLREKWKNGSVSDMVHNKLFVKPCNERRAFFFEASLVSSIVTFGKQKGESVTHL